MKKKILLATLLISVLTPLQLFAQKASVQNVKQVFLRNINAIKENDEVKGYVALYLLDKKSSKENNFKLNIWDANLTLKYDINIVRPVDPLKTGLIESSFNDETFCFAFFNYKDKKLEYIMFDQNGKRTGMYTVPVKSSSELSMYVNESAAPALVGLPNVGFARYGYDPASKYKKYVVTVFDKNGQKKWSTTYTGKEKNNYTFAYPIAQDENVLVTAVMVRESMLSQKVSEHFLKFHDSATGKELFKLDNKRGKYQYSVSNVTSENDKIFIYGEYFDLQDNIIKDDSKGLFVLVTDKSGNVQKESYTSWTEDIQKAMPNAMLNDQGKRVRLSMQDIIKTADNNYFIVCEQFYRTADAAGIAVNMLGGKAAFTKIVLQDLIVLEFDADFKFKKGNVVKKNKTNVNLPAGLDFYGAPFVAFYLKATGKFDYAFTNESADKKTFSSIYVNYDKEADKGGKKVIGSMSYNKDKEFVEDKINLTSNPTIYIALPAKAGYVAIFEYFAKTKSVDFRMEKLNM